jgi:molybdopterin synthase sulfur carrier subunit
MHVNFYATFRPVVGSKTVVFDLPCGATPAQLLQAIFARFPAMQDLLVNKGGELFSHVHLFINGRDVLHLPQGLDTPLACEDKVDIFPPVGGGSAP